MQAGNWKQFAFRLNYTNLYAEYANETLWTLCILNHDRVSKKIGALRMTLVYPDRRNKLAMGQLRAKSFSVLHVNCQGFILLIWDPAWTVSRKKSKDGFFFQWVFCEKQLHTYCLEWRKPVYAEVLKYKSIIFVETVTSLWGNT